MLKIGKSYIVRSDGNSRLCADLAIGKRRTTMWFGVDGAHEEWLSFGRADPFVMAMLPGAMRGGHEIVCEDPMSERLHYQLTSELVPALSFAGDLYHNIKISAPLTARRVNNRGAAGTGYSGGVDSLYTILRHNEGSELPLTHLAIFNIGNPRRERSTLQKIFKRACEFGAEQNLKALYVDTNFDEILSDPIGDTYTYKNLSCALALQGLFKYYFLASGPYNAKLDLNLRRVSDYDLLTVNCASTESLSVYLSGTETTRVGKLTALTKWEPSQRLLNPCTVNEGEQVNCGHCKKCKRDMTALYAMGQLDKYKNVFDINDYLRHLPERIGYVLAGNNGHNVGAQVAKLLKERNAEVPPSAYTYEKIFRAAKRANMETNRENKKKEDNGNES